MGRLTLGQVSLHECKGHNQRAVSVGWNSSGGRLASASNDKSAKVWSIDGSGQSREVSTLLGHEAGVERVRWHPIDPHILCTAASDRKILLWDVRAPSTSSSSPHSQAKIAELNLMYPKNNTPSSVEWHPDGVALAVTERDNWVYVYDLRKTLALHNSTSPNGFSRQSQPHRVEEPIIKSPLRPDVVTECHFSPTGKHLVAIARSSNMMGNIKIWECDIDSPSKTRRETSNKFIGHTGQIYCLNFSPCKTRLATGGADALVGLWDMHEMTCTSTVGRLTKFIRSVSFSHDSRLIASSSEEPFIDIANAQTGEKVGHIETKCGADELAWNPNHYALAYACGKPPEVNVREKDREPFVVVAKIVLRDS